jgi:putative DNA methylase
MSLDRRFIEESFPVKEVSVHSAKEKNIRHGHISTLHIWWARRPLAASRATSYAALIPAPKSIEEWNRQRNFIIEFSKWENTNNSTMIEQARQEILKAYGGKPPKVLDPFAGGGSIPLETLRLGCETYASDLNPVAVLIEKCTLEYPQKYGKPGYIEKEVEEFGRKVVKKFKVENVLVEEVKKWGEWVLNEAKKEISRFYPPDPDGSIPVGYIWARTIPCQNPTCGAEIPLMRQFWLAKKDKRKISLLPYTERKTVKFKIIGTGYDPMPPGFDPEKGTVSRAVAKCPVCGATIDANTTRRLFQEKKSGERMVAVVLHKPGQNGKRYRIANEADIRIFKETEKYLEEKRENLREEWGIDPVPDEPITRVPVSFGVINVWVYGMNTWGDLFNARQKLALITFIDKVRRNHEKIVINGNIENIKKILISYLGLGLDRLLTYLVSLTRWRADVNSFERIFERQALPMVWDYGEVNPFSGSRGHWDLSPMLEAIYHCSRNPPIIESKYTKAKVLQTSVTLLPYSENFFDTVFTDPPYYDNVPYSYLSDFFYVWLKRSLADIYPDLFSTPLTPKKNEIVAYSQNESGYEGGKAFFESMLKQSFQEIHRVLKTNGIAVIVYAHKSTEGWETLINSLLDSGLIITGTWPLNTEMAGRMRAQDSATLASSIYIVARKMDRLDTGFYNNIKEELKNHLNKKLERLWQEGIGGADFFIAAIGSSIEVFGKYKKVIDYEGTEIRANRWLQDVREIVTDYAIKQILHNGFVGSISPLTRFYLLWRWNFGEAKVIFDEAKKLATGSGIDLANEWIRAGFIKKDREFIRVLGPHDRKLEELNNPVEMIDILHRVLLLWEKGKKDEILNVLNKSGFGKNEAFYRVGQAISETLPNESKEKKLLDGFLTGREKIQESIRSSLKQGRLF